jgi:predicted O-linked N-acetylglucosamine transferase (SPINDLY family)
VANRIATRLSFDVHLIAGSLARSERYKMSKNPPLAGLQAKFEQAQALHQRGQLAGARSLYEEILRVQSRHFGALHYLGVIAAQTNQAELAVELMAQSIQINQHNAMAFNNYGNALTAVRRHAAALDSYAKAIALNENYADAYYNRGIALFELAQYQAAVHSYDKAIALNGIQPEAFHNRGNALYRLEQYEAAQQSYRQAIALKSDYVEAHLNRGNALRELNQLEAALDSYNQAIALKADYAEAHSNRGNTLRELSQLEAALASCDRAIALQPDFADAYSNRGIVLKELKQWDAAIANYDEAIALRPDHAGAFNNRGSALHDLKRYDAAIESYDQALALKPDIAFVFGMRQYAKMQICDWSRYEAEVAELTTRIERGEPTENPFCLLAISGSPQLQKKAAEIWVRRKCPPNGALPPIARYVEHDKLRIGYFSADFRDHPVSMLAAEFIETHDRSRYEVTAFSFGPDTQDAMRRRMQSAFDRFIDVRGQSDREVALLARTMEIDVAVDLGGFTQDCRPNIFALRSAPLQVSYLGFAATMGAPYMDYLMADSVIVPEHRRHDYAEKILYLPNSCLPRDSTRTAADRVFTREELGLPPRGFVFCCFNANHKITPATFDAWMRILRRVDGSVLWLAESNSRAAGNLRQEAVNRGVSAERVVFAKRVPSLAEHLARHRAADLFLDTLPCNAHTTASDALWAGLPVLTCMGEAFASRMAASLLQAIRMPELITSTQAQFEDLAVDLAGHPQRLSGIRQELAGNRLRTPLFDTQLFTRHLEAAYTKIYERYRADLPTDHTCIAGPVP